MKVLTSAANPRVRGWLRLATTPRAIREARQTLAEGAHLAEAIARSHWPVSAALLRRGAREPAIDTLLAALPGHIERFELSASLYDRIAPVEHGLGLTLVIPIESAPAPMAAGEDLIYLDAIQDPSNVGAVFRSAAAAGIRHVLCGRGTAAAWSPRCLRAGMGAHFRLKISEAVGADALGAALDGTWIAAVAAEAPSLWSCPFPQRPVGWAFGSEGAGLSAAALAQCTLRVSVPLERDIESLNVAAAAAICLFERRRRLETRTPQAACGEA